MHKEKSLKILGTTLTVASLSITSLVGTAAFAAESPEKPATITQAEGDQLSPVITTYQNQNLVAESSADPNAIVASVTVKPEFTDRVTGEKISATDAKAPQEFWDFGAEGYQFQPEPPLYNSVIDEKTGEYTIQFTTAALNKNFTFNLGVTHTDGSSEEVSFVVHLATSADQQKLNNKYSPVYTEIQQYLRDSTIKVDINADTAPASSDVQGYSVDTSQIANWNIAVDPKTGVLTASPKDPKKMPIQDEEFTVPVVLTYTDGSQDQLPVYFTWKNVESSANTYTVQYNSPDYLPKGIEFSVVPEYFTTEYTGNLSQERISAEAPEGTTYEPVKTDVEGIKFSIDSKTGAITYTIDPNSTAELITVPVRIKYADGSSTEVDAEFYPLKNPLTSTDISNMKYEVSSNVIEEVETYWLRPNFYIPSLSNYEISYLPGASYSLTNVSPELNATIDESGNIEFHLDMLPLETTDYHYTVNVTLPDGTIYKQTFPLHIKGLDARLTAKDINEMWYGDNQVPVVAGQDHEFFPVYYVQALSSSDEFSIPGVTYALKDATPGINARIDEKTGVVTVRFDTLPEKDTEFSYTVQVKFLDGTVHEQTFTQTLSGSKIIYKDSSTTPDKNEPTTPATQDPAPVAPTSPANEAPETENVESPVETGPATPGWFDGSETSIPEPGNTDTGSEGFSKTETPAAVAPSDSQIAVQAPTTVQQDGAVQTASETSAQQDAELASTGAQNISALLIAGVLALLAGGYVISRRTKA